MRWTLGLMVGLLVCGCAENASAPPPAPIARNGGPAYAFSTPPQRPAHYTIEIVNATVAPGKGGASARTSWDGMPIPPATATKLATALGASAPQAVVVGILGELVNNGIKAPDVMGDIQIVWGARPVGTPLLLQRQSNSYLASWHPRPQFANMVLDDSIRVRVHLVDVDVMFHDDIGAVDIPNRDLQIAAQKGTIHQVAVHDQNPQILFVGVSVIREPG